MNFTDLGLNPDILRALAEKGYEKPTPIQEKAIPIVLMARDLIGLAQTGTGKTAGFTLPMIEILAGGRAKIRMPRSLVLAPTRELAAQVAENFATYSKYSNLSHALLVGGESMTDQRKLLDRGVDVLIATPGRMLDLFERGTILLNDIKILVIDEADRMLDMGFIPDIERIISLIPAMSQKLLFSATMPPEIERLAAKFLHSPKTIKVDPPASPAETVDQKLIWITERDKPSALRSLIKSQDVKNAFVFCNRKKDVATLARYLSGKGLSAAPLHGDMSQPMRTKTLQDFKDGQVLILVCSDVAARGLDVKAVSHVFNYDVPFHAEDYVHRIGRTGRAGMTGCTFMLATSEDTKSIQAIEKMMGKPIPVVAMDGFTVPDVSGAEAAVDHKSSSRRRPSSGAKKPARAPDQAEKKEKADKSVSHGRSSARPAKPAAKKPAPEKPIRLDDTKGDQALRDAPARAPRSRSADEESSAGFGGELPAFLRR